MADLVLTTRQTDRHRRTDRRRSAGICCDNCTQEIIADLSVCTGLDGIASLQRLNTATQTVIFLVLLAHRARSTPKVVGLYSTLDFISNFREDGTIKQVKNIV